MQMSIERFRAVHKLIWNNVIEHVQEVKEWKTSVQILKEEGINKAVNEGLLDEDEANFIIYRKKCCLLCALYPSCNECVLVECRSREALYVRAVYGDKDAMIEIRDIVDKKPFIKLSIVTLYD